MVVIFGAGLRFGLVRDFGDKPIAVTFQASLKGAVGGGEIVRVGLARYISIKSRHVSE